MSVKASILYTNQDTCMCIRLGQFRWVPCSTRFQIENWNRGSTLLKNRVAASVGSGSESFKYPIPRATAPVKYPIPKAVSRTRLRQNA